MSNPTPKPTAKKRLLITCESCGRSVYAVPGDHTMAGGPPTCSNTHVAIAEVAAATRQAFEEAAEIAEARGVKCDEVDRWSLCDDIAELIRERAKEQGDSPAK